ncbi:MAG: prepilin-type N-terminal cleavage/methylation domain-containing protein [Verrucomicrobia bacterium]|jgi:prepilin-type N-terminal cleavage/methylation domain-containing protein|nr:prepilin-type N-terminal cleavage/methylation domain-containing protein [Verrucomicrobiota bacterium]
MKTPQLKPQRHGFTLIEMVGVLAVIAILAAILVPKIFAAIDESRYNNTVASCNGVKAAVMSYFAKQGSFPAAQTDFDQTLISQGYLENPFTPKIGAATSDVVTADAAAMAAPKFNNLDGTGGANSAASGTVVYIDLGAIAIADAIELSRRIDGPGTATAAGADGTLGTADDIPGTGMTEENPAVADTKGRVVYTIAGGKANTRVYLAHK